MPTVRADRPKPTAAMLAGEPGWLRSRIRPLAGFASFQKNWNAVRWTLSSTASVVCAFASAAISRHASVIARCRFICLPRDPDKRAGSLGLLSRLSDDAFRSALGRRERTGSLHCSPLEPHPQRKPVRASQSPLVGPGIVETVG